MAKSKYDKSIYYTSIVEDGLGCQFAGDLDMVFVSPTNIANPAQGILARALSTGSKSFYSINGKKVASFTHKNNGILLSKSGAGMTANIYMGR